MSAAIDAGMTLDELLALPDSGMDRELIRGQLKEQPMTYRNRFHSRAVNRTAYELERWLEQQPEPCGEVHSGEVGCILRHDPDTLVGIDVAYFPADVITRQTEATTLIDGVPALAAEVLSPSDKTEDIRDKVLEYLATGVSLVWIIDPYFRTVTVHRRGAPPRMFNDEETLSGSSVLPGLQIAVAKLF